MPQSGFHGLVGLATARALMGRVPAVAQGAFAFGTVLGAVLPDIDLYPTVVAVKLLGMDVYAVHRSFSHSIFVVLVFALLGWGTAAVPKRRWLWWGLAIGCLTHEVLDIFFWFARLDIMWPLSHFPKDKPLFSIIDVWNGNYPGITKGLVPNIRDAFEFPAFAWMLTAIRKAVLRVRPDADFTKQLKWEDVLWGYFPVTLVTAYVYRDNPSIQQLWVNVPYLLAFLPYCWSRIWIYREDIAAWCRLSASGGENDAQMA